MSVQNSTSAPKALPHFSLKLLFQNSLQTLFSSPITSAIVTITAIAATLVFSSPTLAFMTVQESNEITPIGKYKLGFEPQAKTSNGNGANFTTFLDAPINDEFSTRVHLGAGDRDYYVGGSLKWVPIPDYDKQPAIGGKLSVIASREVADGYFTFTAAPIVSKKFPTDIGVFIPYASVPVSSTSGASDTVTNLQLAVGSEYLHNKADNMTFGAELGFDLKDTFSYASAYVTIYLDEKETKHRLTK